VVAVVCAPYAAIERRDFPSLLALLAPASNSTTPICPAAGPSPALVLVEVLTLLEVHRHEDAETGLFLSIVR
jgi:hypothetical protein